MLGIVFVFVALFVVLPQVLKYLVMAGVMPSEVLFRLIYSVYAGRGILIGLVLGVCVWTLVTRMKAQKGDPLSEKENLSEQAPEVSDKSDIDKPAEE